MEKRRAEKDQQLQELSPEELLRKINGQLRHLVGLKTKMEKNPDTHPKKACWEKEVVHLEEVAIPRLREIYYSSAQGADE